MHIICNHHFSGMISKGQTKPFFSEASYLLYRGKGGSNPEFNWAFQRGENRKIPWKI